MLFNHLKLMMREMIKMLSLQPRLYLPKLEVLEINYQWIIKAVPLFKQQKETI
jgi:hypothetical protein